MSKKIIKVLAFGWYGAGNIGDELLLSMLKAWCDECDAELSVLSISPEYTEQTHNVKAIDIYDLPAVARAMQEIDLFILGGGGLFQTHHDFSISALYSYNQPDISAYARPLLLSKQFGLPVLLWAQGIGPLGTLESRNIVHDIFTHANFVSVRDDKSLSLLKEIGVTRDIVLAPDPVWAYPEIAPKKRLANVPKRIAIILRPWYFHAGWEDKFITALKNTISPSEYTLVWLPFQTTKVAGRSESDIPFIEQIIERIGHDYNHELKKSTDIIQIHKELANSDSVICMRLHAQILAIKLAKPSLFLEYDPKMTGASIQAGIPEEMRLTLDKHEEEWISSFKYWLNASKADQIKAEKVDYLVKEALEHRELLSNAIKTVRSSNNKRNWSSGNFDWLGAWADDISFKMMGKGAVNKSEISRLYTNLIERTREITNLNQALSERDGQLALLNKSLSERDEQICELNLVLNSNQHELYKMRTSTSWIVTRPLRFIKLFFMRPKTSTYDLLKFIFWRLPPSARHALHIPRHKFIRWARRSPLLAGQGKANNDSDISWDEFNVQVLSRRSEYKGIFIQEFAITWNTPLYQRPQHIAAAFGRLGYLVIYKTENWTEDNIEGFREVVKNVWITNRTEVNQIEGAVRSVYSTAYKSTPSMLLEVRDKGTLVYEYIDHIDPRISGDAENVKSLLRLKDFAFTGGVDYIVASARILEEEAIEARGRDKVILVPNGVDTKHYRNQINESTPLSEQFRSFRKRYSIIVGYFGALAPWLWYEVISDLTAERQDLGFVFIGPDYYGGADKLPNSDNVLYLKAVDYKILPAYAHQFDVCFIPFAPGDIAHTTSPLKLYEYFALEKPVVVTSEMKECTVFEEVFSGDSAITLSQAINSAIKVKNDKTFKKRLAQLADNNDWDQRVKTFESVFNHDLFKYIVDKYGVTLEFVEMYFKKLNLEHYRRESWDRLYSELDPLKRLYLEFAMTTVTRGRTMAGLLKSNSCLKNKQRYLDVGTGYGGFLRAFKESGFAEVVGVELQEFLAEYARANVSDIKNAQVLNIDFEKNGAKLGQFDLVTCNDVIEHVKNPSLTIKKMASLIANNGCLCLEVPNDDCIEFVKSDGHFQIFGLTKLDREEAATYYSEVTGMTRENYLFEMGECHEMDWYIERMAENGLTARLIETVNVIGTTKEAASLIADLKKSYKEWHKNSKQKLNSSTAKVVETAIDDYISNLESDFKSISDETSTTKFTDKYLRSFWTLVAFKHSS